MAKVPARQRGAYTRVCVHTRVFSRRKCARQQHQLRVPTRGARSLCPLCLVGYQATDIVITILVFGQYPYHGELVDGVLNYKENSKGRSVLVPSDTRPCLLNHPPPGCAQLPASSFVLKCAPPIAPSCAPVWKWEVVTHVCCMLHAVRLADPCLALSAPGAARSVRGPGA